jgi:uncharacterized membrane protein
MLGMGLLGTAHTLIGLVALILGIVISLTKGRITIVEGSGKAHALLTAITCLTSLGIYEHGGFGKPHVLAILTLLALTFAVTVEVKHLFSRDGARISAVAWSLTILFHLIPGVTETSTRLPLGAPLLPNADAPQLQIAYLGLFALFCLGAFFQIRHIKAA